MFYIADNATNPRKFVSLELINGKLQFSFSLGDASLTITTQNDYADGKWHLVNNNYHTCLVFALPKINDNNSIVTCLYLMIFDDFP